MVLERVHQYSLSEKLGYKNKGVLYNTSEKIRAQNPEFDAKQSEFFVDSTNPGTGKRIKAFVIEKFDEFKAFFQGGKVSEDAISIAEFAKILGVSKSCLQIRFFQFFHDEKVDEATKKEVDSWFEHKGQKPDHKTALKKQFLNDAIALFGKNKQQCVVSKEQQACTKNVEQSSKKQSKKTKSAKPATKAKKSSNDVKSVQDIVSVQPKNMLDVIALDKTLKQLTEFYADACNEQDLAEACYNEKLAALQVAPVEQRKELLIDAQRATESLFLAVSNNTNLHAASFLMS